MQGSDSDDKSHMIMEMEKKMNPFWFFKRSNKDEYCTVSSAQYWDWLTYIDVRISFMLTKYLG